MKSELNLRRHPRTHILFGVLVILVATLMLIFSNGEWGRIIFGGLFMLGGIATVTYFNRLHIDQATGELVHRRGLLFPFSIKRYAVSKIRGISLAVATIGDGDDRKPQYVVGLSGIRDATVSSHGNPWFSRILAEQLARRLRVPLSSRVYGKSSRREAGEMDLPLIQRWQRDGTRFAEPALPGKSRLRKYEDAATYVLAVPAQHPKLKFVAFGSILVGILALSAAPTGLVFGTAAFIMLGAFAILGGTICLALAGPSTLSIGNGEITFRQGWFPLRSRIRMDAVEELVVATDGITLIGDEGAVWIHWAGSQLDSEYLEAAVPYQINRLSPRVH